MAFASAVYFLRNRVASTIPEPILSNAHTTPVHGVATQTEQRLRGLIFLQPARKAGCNCYRLRRQPLNAIATPLRVSDHDRRSQLKLSKVM